MRGVDLDLFDFDYDLTWMAFFLNADGKMYGRFGSREPDAPGKYLSLPGLQHALREALAAHRQERPGQIATSDRPPRTADQYPAANRLAPRACIHCHQVYDFRREAMQQTGTWRLEQLWVYPLPQNVGLTLDPDRGNRVTAVTAASPAARAGILAGDTLKRLGGLPTASFADVQYGLHRAPARGEVSIAWLHEGKLLEGRLQLAEGWRKTDVSWRWSLRGLQPASCLHGEDLTPPERKELGLGAKQLAFRQGNFVTPPARHAGIQQNDIILGIDRQRLEMTARQFDAYVRLNYRPGDRVTVQVLRDGKRLDLEMKLPG